MLGRWFIITDKGEPASTTAEELGLVEQLARRVRVRRRDPRRQDELRRRPRVRDFRAAMGDAEPVVGSRSSAAIGAGAAAAAVRSRVRNCPARPPRYAHRPPTMPRTPPAWPAAPAGTPLRCGPPDPGSGRPPGHRPGPQRLDGRTSSGPGQGRDHRTDRPARSARPLQAGDLRPAPRGHRPRRSAHRQGRGQAGHRRGASRWVDRSVRRLPARPAGSPIGRRTGRCDGAADQRRARQCRSHRSRPAGRTRPAGADRQDHHVDVGDRGLATTSGRRSRPVGPATSTSPRPPTRPPS